jgi:hypothetical protein
LAAMPRAEQILRSAYGAFNARDVEAALELRHADVDRPIARKGARCGRPHRGSRQLGRALCPHLEGLIGCPGRPSELPGEQ